MEEINGWLACMGRGGRSATIVTPEAIEAQRNGDVSDARHHHTCVHFSHGPYIDDWSRVSASPMRALAVERHASTVGLTLVRGDFVLQVPEEVAKKYNTSPTYEGQFPAGQGWSYKKM